MRIISQFFFCTLAFFGSVTIALAQGTTVPKNLIELVNKIADLINRAIPLVLGLTLTFFIWGVFSYLVAGDNEEKLKNSKNIILYGSIAMFVMVSFWGFARILKTSLLG